MVSYRITQERWILEECSLSNDPPALRVQSLIKNNAS